MNSLLGMSPEKESAKSSARDWQLILLVLAALGVVLTGLSIWAVTRAAGADGEVVGRWVPPLLFGIFTLLILGSFYFAQRQALFRALEQELINQKIEAELNRELALMDPVTEVYNRRYVRVVLKREIGRVQRYNTGLALMMLDITGFRHVNASLGQAGGDVVLRQIAHLIQSSVRNSDIVIRYGGDEFLAILTDTQDKAGVEQLGVRLRRSLDVWARRSGLGEFDLAFALGIAHYSPEHRVDELLGLAEQRMLQDRRPQSADSNRTAAAATGGSDAGGKHG